MFHSQTLLAESPVKAPAARIRPCGLNAIELTVVAGPVSRLARGVVVVAISRAWLAGDGQSWLAARSSWAASDGSAAASWSASVMIWLAIAWSRAARALALC